jgi:hypothetical protein
VTALFVAVTAHRVHGTLLGYVRAGAEAAMVGEVADWSAVTVLFGRPLGRPIPHTGLIASSVATVFLSASAAHGSVSAPGHLALGWACVWSSPGRWQARWPLAS